jgi:AcrR family transcriptional regulator
MMLRGVTNVKKERSFCYDEVMPKVSDQHKAEQRDRILRGAMEVFVRKGVASTTMGDIIEATGLSAGAIYGYYAGKDDLIRQVAEDVLLSRRSELERLARGEPLVPPSQLIRALLGGLLAELPEPALVLHFWAQSRADARVRAVAERALDTLGGAMNGYLTAWFRSQGMTPARARTRAARVRPALISLIQGFVVQNALGFETDVDTYAAAVEAALDGSLRSAAI